MTKSTMQIQITVLVALLYILPLGQVFAWTKTADFESGTVGQRAQGTSGFTSAGSATTFSTDRAAAGTKSAKMLWSSGSTGFAVDHGTIVNPQRVNNGQEIWARGYYYFASPWDWSNGTNSQFIKIFRFHIANSSGGHAGYLSIIADGAGHILPSNEMVSGNKTISTTLDINAWQYLEMYVKLSPNTGEGIMRIWKNGTLVFENKTNRTLSSSSDYADFSYIMTEWNLGCPQNQTQYVDEFVITTDRPSKTDSKGNPMIGLGSGGTGGTTEPPTTPPSTTDTTAPKVPS